MVLSVDHTYSSRVDQELEGDWAKLLCLGYRRRNIDAVAQHSPVVKSLFGDSESVADDACCVFGRGGVVHGENLKEVIWTYRAEIVK